MSWWSQCDLIVGSPTSDNKISNLHSKDIPSSMQSLSSWNKENIKWEVKLTVKEIQIYNVMEHSDLTPLAHSLVELTGAGSSSSSFADRPSKVKLDGGNISMTKVSSLFLFIFHVVAPSQTFPPVTVLCFYFRRNTHKRWGSCMTSIEIDLQRANKKSWCNFFFSFGGFSPAEIQWTLRVSFERYKNKSKFDS